MPLLLLQVVLIQQKDYLIDKHHSQLATDTKQVTAVDGGDFLRNVTGISGTRMGGHGIDPIIRGQNQTRLNILLDGAYVHGGCPNRMDPPTAYAPVETYDQVTVMRGLQSVMYGSGGSGGTVLFERRTAHFSLDKPLRAQAGFGYTGNAGRKESFADVAAGNEMGFIRGIASYMDADNYTDGQDREVRSAFNNKSGTLILGYTPSKNTRLELSYEANREDDVLFAGSGMDAPISDNDTFRVKFQQNHLKAEIYRSNVEHVMDNFSLRPLTSPMKMLTDTTSKTKGGRLSNDFVLDNKVLTVGVDYQKNTRHALRWAGKPNMPTPTSLQSIMWPDVELEQIGLFGEMFMPIGEMDVLKLGIRYDRVNSVANAANQTAMGGVAPNQLYQKYYGKKAEEQDENNIGGLIRYEHSLTNDSLVFATVSRSVRTADASERYLSGNHNMGKMRWVGNPDLAPEKHHQIELGHAWQGEAWQMTTTTFYNDVSDFILRDKARGQAGILQSDLATIYRNVDARLFGVEWEATLQWQQNWTSHLSLAYVHATNTTDNRPIAQTPPLEGLFNLEYHRDNWLVGSRLRFATQQNRIDISNNAGSGQDVQPTAGFGVLDLYANANVGKYTTVQLGLDNVFDKTYAYHVNRANADPFNPDPVLVNEMGRAAWLKVKVRY